MPLITIMKNGPYVVEGETVTVVDWAGHEYRVQAPRFALCRRGASASKPFCDGTHSRVGFAAEELAGTIVAKTVGQRVPLSR